jgi:hypothetical protein
VSAKFDSNKNYYAVLGIGEQATTEEIERAFRDLAQKRHPDHGGSEEAMKSLNEAREVLTDPETRKAYDAGRMPAVESHPRPPGFDPYAASRAGTLGIPVSDPDIAGLIMGAVACLGLGLPLLLLVELQWVFFLWPLRLMSLGALCIGIYLSYSALRLKQRKLTTADPLYPVFRLTLHKVLFWVLAGVFLASVIALLYLV